MRQKATNIVWHHGQVSPAEREKFLGQKGMVLWFTGLSGSGKSTVAHEVEAALVQLKKNAFVLDGDNIRHGLNSNLGFSDTDRTENIRRLAEVTKLFCDANVLAITSFISPFRKDREAAKKIIGAERFFEIYCEADLATCEKRDPKGLYKKARAGEIADFTGITSPYQAPLKPDLVLNTGKEEVAKSVENVLAFLKEKQFL
ncbi:MAG TPA: adenylyl-sulfate kinase [Deltaproteobacteria bacterium]|nr:MAG: adenylyl-sulfate kinase [Deltaproteobacteria bacterium GWA2_45_12]HBF12584.1 adenylyl-sulfate kinase [Deltaproteobacteria bacterium]